MTPKTEINKADYINCCSLFQTSEIFSKRWLFNISIRLCLIRYFLKFFAHTIGKYGHMQAKSRNEAVKHDFEEHDHS